MCLTIPSRLTETLRRLVKAVAILSALAGPATLSGQSPAERDGLWFSAGIAWGTRSCEDCGGRVGGLSGGLAVGGTLRPSVLLGVAANGWLGHVVRSSPGVTSEGNEMLATLTPIARYYPFANGRLSVLGGAGLALTVTGFAEGDTGLGAVLGLAYDVSAEKAASFNLFCQGTTANVPGHRANLLQVGAGMLIH